MHANLLMSLSTPLLSENILPHLRSELNEQLHLRQLHLSSWSWSLVTCPESGEVLQCPRYPMDSITDNYSFNNSKCAPPTSSHRPTCPTTHWTLLWLALMSSPLSLSLRLSSKLSIYNWGSWDGQPEIFIICDSVVRSVQLPRAHLSSPL